MISQERIRKNLVSLLNEATPQDLEHGRAWYRDARLFAYHVSKRYNFPFVKVCAVIAALSPRSKWERNKFDAENLINAVLSGSTLPKCSTYGAMVRKAVNIIKCEGQDAATMLRILNGPKISAFFLNIYDGENRRVTVDTWIHLAAHGKYKEVKKRKNLGIVEYRKIESEIKSLSNELNLKPYETQAILWVSFKRKTEEKDFN